MSVAAPWCARASDEDSSAQVYLVFDPETGEFVTSHDPNAAPPTQTGLESPDAQRSPSGSDRAEAGMAGKPMLLAAAVTVIVVGGASFAFLRSRRKAD